MNRLPHCIECFSHQDNTADRYFRQTIPIRQLLPTEQKEMRQKEIQQYSSWP
jgi:uncharacterized protein YfdQ (DUF2303 family)